MNIKKLSLILSAILFAHAVFADVDIPCDQQNNLVFCPAQFTNQGKETVSVLLNNNNSNFQLLGNQTLPLTISLPAVTGNTVQVNFTNSITPKNSCNYTFMIKQKSGKFFAEYQSLIPGGRPKLCSEGGSPALTVGVDVDSN